MTSFDIVMIVIFFVLIIVVGIVFFLGKKKDSDSVNNSKNEKSKNKDKTSKNSKKQLEVENVTDFMKFDKIQDNMIELEGGTKYVMILQCQGINYYLMSENEKLAVEQGFIQLLNTLRHKIQFYIQTRRVDLHDSINQYQGRIVETEKEITDLRLRLEAIDDEQEGYVQKTDALKWEITKKERLLDYIKDVTKSVEKISSNKNVLQRKFYVVIPYYTSDLGFSSNFDEDEKKEIAYNELYTRATSIASALNACSVEAKILDSNELGELLYIAYNRDEANILDLRKAMESGFYKLYSTSKDVLQKKQEMYEAKVKEEALQKAQKAVKRAITDIMQEQDLKAVFSKEVLKEAEAIIENSRSNYSEQVIDKALNNVREEGKASKNIGTKNTEEENKTATKSVKTTKTTKTTKQTKSNNPQSKKVVKGV